LLIVYTVSGFKIVQTYFKSLSSTIPGHQTSIDLGFGLNLISLLQEALDRLKERYSSPVVWDVLKVETAANMATTILNVEVMHHSYESTKYRKTKDEDETDTTESLDEQEDTPCPTPPVIRP